MEQIRLSLPKRYDIVGAIGGGGGGNVFEVQDRCLKRRLALKLCEPSKLADEEAFKAEFLLAASVSHPGLVKVFDFGYDSENRPFFTMELAQGAPAGLTAGITDCGRFIAVIAKICSALGLLHRLGYKHNDLKPDNIRVAWSNDAPSVKLLDFGLARAYDPSNSTELAGTIDYMAPELFNRTAPSVQSDIYSLGVIAYQLVAGRLPFSGTDPLEIISGHLERSAPAITSTVFPVSDSVIQLIMRMLSKNPADRPRSTAAIFVELAESSGLRPEDFEEDETSLYFESAVASSVMHSPEFTTALQETETSGFRLLCTSDLLAQTALDLAAKALQTRFINVRASDDDTADTCTNSTRSVHLHVIRSREGESCMSHTDFIARIGNYGLVEPEISGLPAIVDHAIVNRLLDSLLAAESNGAEFADAISELCSGNLELARKLFRRFYFEGLVETPVGTLVARKVPPAANALTTDESDVLMGDVPSLGPDFTASLMSLSVFSHQFTAAMAGEVLNRRSSDAEAFLAELSRMRLLESSEGSFHWNRPQIQRVLHSRLDGERVSTLHHLIADHLVAHDYFSKSMQAGMIGLHYCLSGNVEKAIEFSIEYQRSGASGTVFIDPEELLNHCDRTMRELGTADSSLESRLLMAYGDLYKAQGKTDAAMEKYTRITQLQNVDPRLLAETYKDLGDIHKSRVDFHAGIEALMQALEIYRSIDDRIEISHTLNNIGNIYWINSEYQLALNKYKEALTIQEQLNSLRDIASTLSNIGTTYNVLGSHEDAIEHYTRSLKLKEKLEDQPEIARTYNNMAITYMQIGESGKALNFLNRSMAINRGIGAQKELLFNLENVAEVCMGLGEHKRCEEVSAEGLALARRLDDIPHLGVFSFWLGAIYAERGLYGTALGYIDQAVDLSNKVTDKPFAARSLLLKARVHLALCEVEVAAECISKSRMIVSPFDSCPELVRLRTYAARLEFISGSEHGAVIAAVDEAERRAQQLKLGVELCETLVLRLDVLTDLGRIPGDILERLDRLTGIDQHTMYRSYLYFYSGIAAVQDKMHGEALSYLDQAEVMARAFEQRELLCRINYQIGKICMAQLEYEDAFVRLKQATSILKEIVSNIGDREMVRRYMSSHERNELIKAVRSLAAKLA
jgi:serine/threonine protein kinase/tetratricopeptide (TPR) repeat protein